MAFDLSKINDDNFIENCHLLTEDEIRQLIDTGAIHTECEIEDDVDDVLKMN